MAAHRHIFIKKKPMICEINVWQNVKFHSKMYSFIESHQKIANVSKWKIQ